MGKEIERKFLVVDGSWRQAKKQHYRQGYLSSVKERIVRVRTIDDVGYLTVKGLTVGLTRSEYEYAIPAQQATEMLDDLCEKPLIEKYRYTIEQHAVIWEIDEFFGENAGLIVAEVELQHEDQVLVAMPAWISTEVTHDPRYFNSNLIKNPYTSW